MPGRDQDVVPRRVMSAYWGLRSGLRVAVSGRLDPFAPPSSPSPNSLLRAQCAGDTDRGEFAGNADVAVAPRT
jgi:hypothetical protein